MKNKTLILLLMIFIEFIFLNLNEMSSYARDVGSLHLSYDDRNIGWDVARIQKPTGNIVPLENVFRITEQEALLEKLKKNSVVLLNKKELDSLHLNDSCSYVAIRGVQDIFSGTLIVYLEKGVAISVYYPERYLGYRGDLVKGKLRSCAVVLKNTSQIVSSRAVISHYSRREKVEPSLPVSNRRSEKGTQD